MDNQKSKIENIISQIKKLEPDKKAYLMRRLALLIKRDTEKEQKPLSILELNGLGSEIWEKIDIDYYVHQERQWE